METKTYNISIKMQVTSNQFKTLEDLQQFLFEIVSDYQGTGYKSCVNKDDIEIKVVR